MVVDKQVTEAGARSPDAFEQALQMQLKLSSEWYWEQDEDCRFTVITGAVMERTGLDAKGYVGTARWDNGAIPVGDDNSWDKHRAVLASRQPFRDFVYARVDAAGELRHISASGEPVFDADGGFRGYRGVAKDVTENFRGEQLLRLEHAVTRCLAEADSAMSGVKTVMRTVCQHLSWECCRYFCVDEGAGLLRFADAWFIPAPAIERFVDASRDKVFAPGEGFAGQAWQSGQPVWVADSRTDPRLQY